MSEINRNFKLGLFVLGAIAVLVALVLILGSGRFTRNRTIIESYFDESVQGLDVGSKVKYRGVTIGEVTRIAFTNTKYELDKPGPNRHPYVLVEAAVQSQLVGGRLAMQSERRDLLRQQIDKGLRIRLNPQGVTGTSYLEIDFLEPASNPLLPSDWEPEYLYVPSARSTVTQLVDAVSDFMAVLRKLDLEKAVGQVTTLVATADQRLKDLPIDRYGKLAGEATTLVSELRSTNRQLTQTLARFPMDRLGEIGTETAALASELRESNRALNAVVANPEWRQLPKDVRDAFASAQRLFENPELAGSINRLQRTVGRLERLISSRDGDIGATLENLRDLTDNLRDVTETAKRYPSSILLGEPPAPASALTTTPR